MLLFEDITLMAPITQGCAAATKYFIHKPSRVLWTSVFPMPREEAIFIFQVAGGSGDSDLVILSISALSGHVTKNLEWPRSVTQLGVRIKCKCQH